MKVTTDKPKPTKLVCNIWRPLISRLEVKIKDACLNRDAFLDRVLKYEAKMLEKEITQPNSLKAKRYISDALTRGIFKPVTFYLSEETITIINEKCKHFNIVRDSFVNRIIFLLVAPEDLIRNLFFKNDTDLVSDFYFNHADWGGEEKISLQFSLVNAIADYIDADPFWFLRSCLNGKQKAGKINHDLLLHGESICREALIKVPEETSLETSNAVFLNCVMSDIVLEFDMFLYPVNSIDLQKEKEERKQNREQMKQQEQASRGRVSK